MQPTRKRAAAEENWRYAPTFEEQCQQAFLEMQSRITSLERAMGQLQHNVHRDSSTSPAPLGIDLGAVSPPPWLRLTKEESGEAKGPRAKSSLKSKLLRRA